MKDGNVIEVHNVYKKFKNYNDKSTSLKEKILHRERNKYQENWVLNGIDFEVKRGEAVGLVGCNGCGKSTTLKLLTKIIYPDQGSIEVKGRVSSLLELGAGFHPDLSGYENIYLNAAVFGLTRKEIDGRVDEIIRFSELEEHINNPIRTYSSGMYMKLAFSVAINVDADILLIDEILGVGDVNFQKKCFEKLIGIKNSGTTIVIVSHSTDQIEKICNKSIWIEAGRVKYQGEPREVHARYLECMSEKRIIQINREEEERKAAEQRQREAEEKRQKTVKKRSEEEQRRYEEQQRIKGKEKERLIKEAQKEQEYQQKLIKQIEEEQQNQENMINAADEKRKKIAELQEEVIRKKNDTDRAAYFQSEKARLEVVVQEKNMELERLNSVVREKNAEISRLDSVLKAKEKEVNGILLEKDVEIQRLEGVIRLKETENSALRDKVVKMEG